MAGIGLALAAVNLVVTLAVDLPSNFTASWPRWNDHLLYVLLAGPAAAALLGCSVVYLIRPRSARWFAPRQVPCPAYEGEERPWVMEDLTEEMTGVDPPPSKVDETMADGAGAADGMLATAPPVPAPSREVVTVAGLRDDLALIAGDSPPTIAGVDADETVLGADPPHGVSGRSFGDYDLIRPLARGGMGIVYQARQRKLNRVVVLKMILSGDLAKEEDVRRLQVEAEAAARLDHSGIVPVYEAGEVDGQHFFSMGFIDGGSLEERLQRAGRSRRGRPPRSCGGSPRPWTTHISKGSCTAI